MRKVFIGADSNDDKRVSFDELITKLSEDQQETAPGKTEVKAK